MPRTPRTRFPGACVQCVSPRARKPAKTVDHASVPPLPRLLSGRQLRGVRSLPYSPTAPTDERHRAEIVVAVTAVTVGSMATALERNLVLGGTLKQRCRALLPTRGIAYSSKGAAEASPQPRDKSRTVQSFYNQSAIDVAAAKVGLPFSFLFCAVRLFVYFSVASFLSSGWLVAGGESRRGRRVPRCAISSSSTGCSSGAPFARSNAATGGNAAHCSKTR